MSPDRIERRARVAGPTASSQDLTSILAVQALLLALMAFGGSVALFQVPRIVVGLATTLFVPGYALAAAVLPQESDLDGAERLAASFGLSWAVIPPIALLLNQFPGGLRSWPMVVALAGFSVCCVAVAAFRRQAIDGEPRPASVFGHDFRNWWSGQGRRERLGIGVVAIFGVVLFAATIATVAAPASARATTEFYLLGPDGLAEGYPRQTAVGEPIVVTVGIADHEASPATFRVEATEGGRPIGETRSAPVEPGASCELPLTIRPAISSEDEVVTITLYRDGESSAYRTLRLWLNVTSDEQPTTTRSGAGGESP